jgi:hypothetical protein
MNIDAVEALLCIEPRWREQAPTSSLCEVPDSQPTPGPRRHLSERGLFIEFAWATAVPARRGERLFDRSYRGTFAIAGTRSPP